METTTMIHPFHRRSAVLALSLMAATVVLPSLAQNAPPAQTVRMRGVVQAVTPNSVTVKDRSGEVVELATDDKLVVTEVYPIALEDIKPGSFIGTAAMPQADGSLKAIAVTVFTEAQRNVRQGHFPFDLQPQSTMTNAIVSDVATLTSATGAGRKLQLKYQDGGKTLQVPADAPVVTSRPSDRGLLVPGASVSVFAQLVDGKPMAQRISAGKSGFVLPY
jgi:hypothetical protein